MKISDRLIIASAIVMFAMPVHAQPSPQEFNLKVDSRDIEIIGEGLGALPYSKVAPLMGKLQAQIQGQVKTVPAPAPMPVQPKQELPKQE